MILGGNQVPVAETSQPLLVILELPLPIAFFS
jgi:hypothetical protein